MSLEKQEKLIQYKRVEMAKLEMEFKIKKLEAEIERLKENIEIQNARLNELNAEMEE